MYFSISEKKHFVFVVIVIFDRQNEWSLHMSVDQIWSQQKFAKLTTQILNELYKHLFATYKNNALKLPAWYMLFKPR